jgi:hypothetical protein
LRVARKTPYSRFDRFLGQVQERSRGACRNELLARSDNQDTDARTGRRNVTIRCDVLIPAAVELDAEETETSAQSFAHQRRPLSDPAREGKSVESARRGRHRRRCGRKVVQHDLESEDSVSVP